MTFFEAIKHMLHGNNTRYSSRIFAFRNGILYYSYDGAKWYESELTKTMCESIEWEVM